MKNTFTLIALVALVQISFGQSALPNGNFEAWTYISKHDYWEPDGGFFMTLNILDTVPTAPGITAYPCDTAHSGARSARLITREMLLGPVHIVIPGVIGTLTINWFGEYAKLGKPFTWDTKPERFQGFYKSYPVNGDSTGAILLLSRWNGTTSQRDTIAYNRIVFYTTVDDWTEFDAMIDYWDETAMPDSITVLLLSCAGYNATNMMGSVGQIGSQALFDDVTLTNIAGMELILMPDVEVTLSPNPASDRITVTLGSEVKNGVLTLYNAMGQPAGEFPVQGTSFGMDVSRLTSGTYFFKLSDGTRALNSGSFVIAR